MKNKILKIIALTAMVLVVGVNSLTAQDKWPNKLIFGIIPSSGSTSMKEEFTPLAKYLAKQLGIKIELKFASDYTSVITGMQHNHIDMAYFGPKSYIEAAKRAGAQAIVVEVDAQSGLPGYYGIIITKKGSGLKTLKDLKNKTWAFTSPQSTSGTLIPTVLFSEKGINPHKYFSRVFYSGGHEASILSVKAGRVDAASTNNLDFNRGLGIHWNKSDFNTIWTSKLIPGSPIAVKNTLPNSLKMAIKGALISFDDPVALKKLKDKGFSNVNDSMYDGIRKLAKLENKE